MKRSNWKALIAIIGVLIVCCLAATVVFVTSVARARIFVDLLTGLAWPLALMVAAITFWPHIQVLAFEVVTRVKGGASVRVGPLSLSSLPEQADHIPSPGAGESVSLESIALLHTSFIRSDKTREFNDGRTYYQIEIIVIAPSEVWRRVISVKYELDGKWPSGRRVQTVTDSFSRFKLKELAYGTTIVRAQVELRGQDQPLLLNRFIDLRPDGLRL
ncbi:pYEATS domain-containing protein [Streptomyces sp. SID12501]|uniref:pYEATS domain-containing protein n=1 Tax=Streptomyces sp. SID12501 TaxID=2706042 RepID=UPI0034E0BF46